MAIVLEQIWNLSEDDVEVGTINFTPYLDANELISSVTVTEITTTALTIGNVAKSTGELVILNETVATAKAIQCSVTGQQAGTDYKLAVQIVTDSSPARTKNFCQLISTAPACT